MKTISKTLLAGIVFAGFTAISGQAMATVGPCPVLHTDPSNLHGACNLVVTFNADGSIATSGAGGNYDGADDALIGVVNNSGHTLTSFNVSNKGVGIFGFDGDGIDGYVPTNPAGNNPDKTGYGGPDGFFTGINRSQDAGTVNFANGGILTGHSNYFSLEMGINLNAPPVITPAPEPMGLALFGVGLMGLGLLRSRKTA